MFLQLDLTTILLEIANFLVLSALLYYFLFRPVINRVEERAAEKKRLLAEAEESRREATEMRAQARQELVSLEDRMADVLEKARDQIEAERQEALEAVRQEAERILRQSHREAAEVRRQQLDQFHEELLGTVMTVTRKLVAQVAPESVHNELVDQLNARAWEMGHNEMDDLQALRRSLGEHVPTVRIDTARTLSAEQKRKLVQTFSAVADHTVTVEVAVDGDLAAGLRVRLGDLVMENSIAGRLEELRESVSEALEESMSG